MEYEIGCWGTTERTRMSQEEWDSGKSVNCQWLSPFSRLGWVEAFWAIHTYMPHTASGPKIENPAHRRRRVQTVSLF